MREKVLQMVLSLSFLSLFLTFKESARGSARGQSVFTASETLVFTRARALLAFGPRESTRGETSVVFLG
jgi:hypothetical protein